MDPQQLQRLFESKAESSLAQLQSRTPLSEKGIRAVQEVASKASDAAIRHLSYRFLFEWVAEQLPDSKLPSLDPVYAALVAGLTDVWSAIRKTCNRKLGGVLPRLT